jgi:hypothetical protein
LNSWYGPAPAVYQVQQPPRRHSHARLQPWPLPQLCCWKTEFLNEKAQTCQCTLYLIIRALSVNSAMSELLSMPKASLNSKSLSRPNVQLVEAILKRITNSRKLFHASMTNLNTVKNLQHTQKLQNPSQLIVNMLNQAQIFKCLQAYLREKLVANILMKIFFTFALLVKFSVFVPNASFMVLIPSFRKTQRSWCQNH